MKKIIYLILPILVFAVSGAFAQNKTEKNTSSLPEIKKMSKEDLTKLEEIRKNYEDFKKEADMPKKTIINGEYLRKVKDVRANIGEPTEITFNQRVSLLALVPTFGEEMPLKSHVFKLNLGKDVNYALTNLKVIKDGLTSWTWDSFTGKYSYNFKFALMTEFGEQMLYIKITPVLNEEDPEPTLPYIFVLFKKEGDKVNMAGTVYPIDDVGGRSIDINILRAK